MKVCKTAILFAVAATPSLADALNIDAYGYTVTSRPFSFVDLSSDGTAEQVIFENTDDPSTTIPIGFAFDFYGDLQTEIGVSPNGLLTFNGRSGDFSNESFDPGFSGFNGSDLPAIAPLWDDWQFFEPAQFAGGIHYQTYGQNGDRRLVVQWEDAFHYENRNQITLPVTFQTVLYEATGDIRFNYLGVNTAEENAFGSGATIGIRNSGSAIAGAANEGQYLEYASNELRAVNNFESLVFEQLPADFEFGIGRNGDLWIRNLSDDGVRLESLEIDFSNQAPDITIFDTTSETPGQDPEPFSVEVTLGDLGVALPNNQDTNGAVSATIEFTDFDPEEAALIGFDLDTRAANGVIIEGESSPSGGFVTATFSNGRSLTREIFDMELPVPGQVFEFATFAPATAIPEPSTVMLALTLAGSLVSVRRRD